MFTTLGGNILNPSEMLDFYVTKGKFHEYGFNPEKEELTINVDGQDITRTYYDWYAQLVRGDYVLSDLDTRLYITAEIEQD